MKALFTQHLYRSLRITYITAHLGLPRLLSTATEARCAPPAAGRPILAGAVELFAA